MTLRLRTLLEMDEQHISGYISYGFYDHSLNKDFWRSGSNLIDKALQYLDVDVALQVIDENELEQYTIRTIPNNKELMYKLLNNGKAKIESYIIDDSLDIARINPDHVDEDMGYDVDMLKFKDIMVYYIDETTTREELMEAHNNGIRRIEFNIDPDDDSITPEDYMSMIRLIHDCNIRLTADNIDVLLSEIYVDVNNILYLLDMGYNIDVSYHLDIEDIHNHEAYMRLKNLLSPYSIVRYSLYSGDRDVDLPTIAVGINLDVEGIKKYHLRPDMMSIVSPVYRYHPEELDALNLMLVYKKTNKRTHRLNGLIIILNSYTLDDYEIDKNISTIGLWILDPKEYEIGLKRLWEMGYKNHRIVKYYMKHYRSMIPFLCPRIESTRWYKYENYPNIIRHRDISDVNIICTD